MPSEQKLLHYEQIEHDVHTFHMKSLRKSERATVTSPIKDRRFIRQQSVIFVTRPWSTSRFLPRDDDVKHLGV